jgi:hypothetical protein
MENQKSTFSDLIRQAFKKINQHPGANEEFYKQFSKSRVLISHWRTGKVAPTIADLTEFLTIASQVIKKFTQKEKALAAENEKKLEEFHALLTE